jgi:hypothetical protein
LSTDWSLKGHNPQLLCTSISDFPQPAFDQLGMQPVPALTLNNSPSNVVVASRTASAPIGGSVARLSNAASQTSVVTTNTDTSNRLIYVDSDLSALSIRATEYLQRWKEVVQFSSKDYSDQMAAQFGIKAPEYMGNHVHYIGG